MTNTTHIPDEAVQVAINAWFEETREHVKSVEPLPEQARRMRLALEAALPHLSAPCAVEVKKLEWSSENPYHVAKTRTGFYCIEVVWEDGKLEYVSLSGSLHAIKKIKSVAEAKAAAQTDFERRILSCVVTKPVDVPALLQEVRNGERDGFINTGKEPHGNDADLSCPCCGGSGHKDDVVTKPVDVAAVRRQAFNAGYVLACCNIVNLHDEPVIAYDTLSELGVSRDEITAMNLSEYDLDALNKIECTRTESPYSTMSRALSPAEPAQGEQWQPIETAPRDGTVILAWHIAHKCPVPVLWKDDGFPYQGERLSWFERTYTTAWPERAFSHWMLLPPAPTSKGGE